MDYTPDLAARCDFFRNLLGNLELRGLRRPVAAFNVVQSTSSAEARPNLNVVATGAGSLILDDAKVSKPPNWASSRLHQQGLSKNMGRRCWSRSERPLRVDSGPCWQDQEARLGVRVGEPHKAPFC